LIDCRLHEYLTSFAVTHICPLEIKHYYLFFQIITEAVAQYFIRRLLAAEARICFQAKPRGIYDWKWH